MLSKPSLPVWVAVLGLGLLAAGGLLWKQGGFGRSTEVQAQPAAGGAPAASAARPAGGPGKAGGPPGPGGPAAVEVAKVETDTIVDDAQAVGSLRSRQSVMLRPEVAGRVVRFNFTDGQPVRKGQLLVQFDDALQQAEVKQAEAQVSIARANFNRNRDLVAQNFVAQRVLDESAASLQVAEAQLVLAQARLARMRVLAPFDAVAGIRVANVGEYLKDGADIVNLEDIAVLFADFRLPERYLGKLAKGQKAQLQVDALPGRKFELLIEAIDPLVDANGRSVLVRGRIDNRGLQLRPGMFARVRTLFGERKDALVVPEEALVPQGNRQFVLKVVDGPEGGKVAQRVEVKTGVRRAGKVEVSGGLQPGDLVVSAGQQRIQRDGQPVRIVDLARAAGGPPGPQQAGGAPGKAQPGAAAPGGAGGDGARGPAPAAPPSASAASMPASR